MDGVDATRRVFISYSSKDRACAETILRTLERRGISCWYAPRDVPVGSNYMGAISRAIQMAEAMVIVLSQNANGSDDMKNEVVLAGKRRIPIIPVRIDTVALDDDWTYAFSVRQVFDASSGLDPILRSLGDQIQQALSGSKLRRPAAAPASAPSVPPPSARSVPPPSPARPGPKELPRRRQPQMISLMVLAGVLVTSVTLGLIVFGHSGREAVQKAVRIAVDPRPVVVPTQKCDGYVPTYPRPPGVC